MLFLIGSFIDISTIHAEAGSRTGSIQIIYKGRNSSDKEVILSGAKFSIFPTINEQIPKSAQNS